MHAYMSIYTGRDREMHAYLPGAAVAGRSTKGRMRRARKKKNVTDSLPFIVAFICVKDSNALSVIC